MLKQFVQIKKIFLYILIVFQIFLFGNCGSEPNTKNLKFLYTYIFTSYVDPPSPLSVQITTSSSIHFNSPTFTANIQFSEVVSGFDASDISITNGTLTSFLGTGDKYTVTLVPIAEGDIVISIRASAASSSSGMTNPPIQIRLYYDITAPTITSVNSTNADGMYKVGDKVSLQVNFSETVLVTGTPQLTLETGAVDTIATYINGSGTSTLNFEYTVVAGDISLDLNYVNTTALSPNDGSIADLASNLGNLSLPINGLGSLSDNKAIMVDTTAPTITSVSSSTPNGLYKIGDILSIQVNFSEIVVVTDTPTLTLETGAVDAVVNYTGGSGTNALTFSYTIESGHSSLDLDYVSSSSLSGTIKDMTGNSANLTMAGTGAVGSLGANNALVIDGIQPTVTGVNSSSPDGFYISGNALSVQVYFSDSVTVTGTPTLTLETGSTDTVISYTGGSGTNTLTFSYTVNPTDTSGDLDYAGTSALSLSGGTIKDASGNSANLALPSPGAAGSLGANRAIVIVIDSTLPTITSINSSSADATYKAGNIISVQVNFSENVVVDTTGGTPTLTLETGATDAVINYTSGSGTSTLVFNYTVGAGHTSGDLDYIGTASLALNGGVIRDVAYNNANLTLPAPAAANSLGANRAITIDTTAPAITGFSVPSNATYKTGDLLNIVVTFGESITVTGASSAISLTIGAATRTATRVATTANTITYQYTVASGDLDADGISITSPIALNGDTITDTVGNSATLSFTAPSTAGVLVDAVAPTISSVSSSTTDNSYKTGQIISIQVTFSENVIVAGGTPTLTLETGATDAIVNYTSGTSSNVLTFDYTIANGENSLDLDYISTSPFSLNGGTITDAVGNTAILTVPTPGTAGSLSANKALVIDTTSPTVTSVTAPTNGSYKAGTNLDVTVNFSEPITVSNTNSTISIDVGGTTRTAILLSTTATSITYRYTVVLGDNDLDGIVVSAGSITLNGDTIKDVAQNNASLTLNSIASTTGVLVDTTTPTITSVNSSSADATYLSGSTIPIQVNFSENVDVDTTGGTPTLTLETGATDAVINYTSGSGTSILVFNYTVGAGHTSGDLDYVGTASLILNSGIIRDVASNNAVLTLPAPAAANSLGANRAIIIDTAVPTITSVTVPTNGSYKAGTNLDVTVNFSEPITITGTSSTISITVGSTIYTATRVAVTANSITYRYIVASGDLDTNGISIASIIVLNGDTITDTIGNPANLSLGTIPSTVAVLVDGIIPSVTSVTVPSDATHIIGANLDFIVHFSENIIVGGINNSTIPITIGATSRTAMILSSTATSITYRYTIVSGDLDTNGITVGSAITLNANTIGDAATNSINTTLNSVASTANINVDGIAPTVTNVTSAKINGNYTTGQTILVQVSFSENVLVTGTPQLTLETGTTDAIIDYFSGSGTSTLIFEYTIADGQASIDLDYVNTTALVGTIKDGSGNNAILTLPTPGAAGSLSANKAIQVNKIDIVSATTFDRNGNGKIDGYKIVFNASVTDSQFPGYIVNSIGSPQAHWIVAGYSNIALVHGTAVTWTTDTINDNTIYIGFDEGMAYDSGAKPDITTTATPGLLTLSQVSTATITEIDGVQPRPVVVNGTVGGTSVGITFSEAVGNGSSLGTCPTTGISEVTEIFATNGLSFSATTDACGNDGTVALTSSVIGSMSYTIVFMSSIKDVAGNTILGNIVFNTTITPPTISYAGSPYTFTKGTAITAITPVSGGGPITSCTSSPTLPSGLTLNNSTCVISGTPTANPGVTSFIITAGNAGGSSAPTITITIQLPFKIVDSGQTSCFWDNSGTWTQDSTCAQTYTIGSATHPFGQDARYINIPTARNYTGPTQHPTYTTDYTTTDNATGLVWKTCEEGMSGATCATGTPTDVDWTTAATTCTALNSLNSGAGYAGRKDWHLPTIYEFINFFNYNLENQTFDIIHFPFTTSYWYWTSSASAADGTRAWVVAKAGGRIFTDLKTSSIKLHCVSGNMNVAQNFTSSGTGVETDNRTGLQWQKCTAGQTNDVTCTGAASSYTWTNAMSYCENLSLGGFTDWRLPSIIELKSIVDYSASSPAIQIASFPNTPASNYWTSTTIASNVTLANTAYAWIMKPIGDNDSWLKNVVSKVRCVR